MAEADEEPEHLHHAGGSPAFGNLHRPLPPPPNNNYALHQCIFNGDIRRLSKLLRTNDVAAKDKHGKCERWDGRPIIRGKWWIINRPFILPIFAGNTALHLAVMLGRKGECLLPLSLSDDIN